MATCPKCQTRKASSHPTLGVLPCKPCLERLSGLKGPDKQVEFTTDSIRYQRKAYSKDIIQPYRSGELSKEYLDAHGSEGIKATPKQIKNARNVWKD